MSRLGVVCSLFLTLLAAPGQVPAADAGPRFRVLVFTEGSPYPFLPSAVDAIRKLGSENGFEVDHTSDSAAFTDRNLARYAAVVWLLTSGDVLDPDQQSAFERYIQSGGGFAGIHSAGVTELAWPWYGDLIGAEYQSHAEDQPAVVNVLDRSHPSTVDLPKAWARTDEWYDFEPNPRGDVHVLATVEESSYTGGSDGFDHPIAWCQSYEDGRSWYTAGGDTADSYSEPLFLRHILGGLEWSAGAEPGDCGGTVWSNFGKTLLDDTTDEPLELDVAQDGRVFFVEREGSLKIYDPAVGSTITAANIPVFTGLEDGLMGIALDPDFEHNGWLYLYYAAAGDFPCAPADTGATSCGLSRLSRFQIDGNVLAEASEHVLLEVPTQRHDGHHSAGSLDFDSAGNLYLSTGDNTSPLETGYTPIDERDGRAPWDAQRTSANTNDLRGKLLRIHPEPNGTYTIPTGNLFPPGADKARPEIYAMGFRNPFRFSVDPENGWVYLGDYGPDAPHDDADRGPRGYVEWNLIKTAGNYGWPYCAGPNLAYRDYDFETEQAQGTFDCDSPSNESPNNTGLTELPAAQPATIWYSYGESTEFPEMGTGCGCPMAGPAYQYDPSLASDRKFPAYYDDTPFFYEWGRDFLKEIKLDGSRILEISSFLPDVPFNHPIDMTFGPDGAMYLLEWGSGFFGNTDSGLYRIDYLNNPPQPASPAPVGSDPPENTDPGDPGSDPDDPGSDPGSGGSTPGDVASPPMTCTPSPSRLQPADGRLVKVGVEIDTGDSIPHDLRLVRVWSNRRGARMGKGDARRDIRGWARGTLDTTGRLRAEAWGRRFYAIEYAATDGVGEPRTCTALVTVGRTG
jgi:glucose/arabinose dehydrogenase